MIYAKQKNYSGGYIALISTIIISILMMAVVFATSNNNFIARFNILNNEIKERSYNLAEACVSTALLKLAQNSSYAGNENISVGSDQCSILPIQASSSQRIIETRANFQNSFTDLKVVTSSTDWSIVSWEEVPKF